MADLKREAPISTFPQYILPRQDVQRLYSGATGDTQGVLGATFTPGPPLSIPPDLHGVWNSISQDFSAGRSPAIVVDDPQLKLHERIHQGQDVLGATLPQQLWDSWAAQHKDTVDIHPESPIEGPAYRFMGMVDPSSGGTLHHPAPSLQDYQDLGSYLTLLRKVFGPQSSGFDAAFLPQGQGIMSTLQSTSPPTPQYTPPPMREVSLFGKDKR